MAYVSRLQMKCPVTFGLSPEQFWGSFWSAFFHLQPSWTGCSTDALCFWRGWIFHFLLFCFEGTSVLSFLVKQAIFPVSSFYFRGGWQSSTTERCKCCFYAVFLLCFKVALWLFLHDWASVIEEWHQDFSNLLTKGGHFKWDILPFDSISATCLVCKMIRPWGCCFGSGALFLACCLRAHAF